MKDCVNVSDKETLSNGLGIIVLIHKRQSEKDIWGGSGSLSGYSGFTVSYLCDTSLLPWLDVNSLWSQPMYHLVFCKLIKRIFESFLPNYKSSKPTNTCYTKEMLDSTQHHFYAF